MKEVLKMAAYFTLLGLVVVTLTIGWLALQDWIFLRKRAEYCERIDVQQDLLTEKGKTRQFYACNF